MVSQYDPSENKQIVIVPAATTPPRSRAAELAYMKGNFPPTPTEREEDWIRCERATFQDGVDGEQRVGIVVGNLSYTIDPTNHNPSDVTTETSCDAISPLNAGN